MVHTMFYRIECGENGNDKKFISVAPSVEMLHGFTAEDLLSNSQLFYNQILPEDKEKLLNEENSALKNMTSYSCDIRFSLSYQEIRWRNIVASPRKEKKGKIIWDGVEIDITEQVNNEQSFKKSEEKFRLLFEKSPDAITISTIDGEFIDCNITALNYYQIESKSGFLKTHASNMYADPEDRKALIQELQSRGNIRNKEILLKKSSGEIRTMLVSVEIIRTENNQPLLISWSRDITSITENMRQIRLLSTIVDKSPVSIVVTDENGNIEYVNPYFTILTGYTFNEVLGRNPNILKAEHFQRDYYKQLWETILAGETWEGDFYNKRKNGTYYWEHAIITPIFESKNKIKGFAAVKIDITENKLLMNRLKESEGKYRALFETSGDAILILSADDWRYTACNAAALEIFGMQDSMELISLSPTDLSPEMQADGVKSVDKANEIIAATLKNGKHHFEWVHKKLNGEEFWVSITTSCITLGDKHYIQSTMKDITEKINRENSLKESFNLINLLFENNTNAILWTNRDGFILKCNPASEILFECSREELIGLHITRLHPENILDGVQKGFSESLQKDASFTETLIITKTGKTKNVQIYSTTIQQKNRVVHQGIFVDITLQKNAEEFISKQREQFELAIRGSNDGIWDWDILNDKLFLSERWKEQLGYADEEIPNRFSSFESNVHPEDKPQVKEYIENYLNGEFENYDIIFRMQHKNGSFRWMRSRGIALRDSSGKPYRMAGSHSDITELKEKEILISNMNQALEEQISIKNELIASKNKFISILAHDLTNPFNVIFGFTELLLTDLDNMTNEEIREDLNMIENSAATTYSLLKDLLSWAQCQQNQIKYSPDKLSILSLIQDSLLILNSPAAAKNIQIHVTFLDDLFLYADRDMLQTILRNLLTNAIKFTGDEGEIFISAEKSGNEQIMIKISDTGVGMDETQKENLFRIEKTASLAGTNGETGSGLGLLLCKEFVEKHGGKIWVESELGKGSDFYFTIPEYREQE